MPCSCKIPGCKVGRMREAEKERLKALIEENYKLRLLVGDFLEKSRELADDYDGVYQELVDKAKKLLLS